MVTSRVYNGSVTKETSEFKCKNNFYNVVITY